jgi:hypothetical protein
MSANPLRMGDEDTTPANTNGTTDTGSVPNRLRQSFAAHRTLIPSKSRGIAAGYALLAVVNLIGIAAAQQGGGGGGSLGSELCGTAIATTINELAPVVLGIVVLGGLMLCYLLHAWSGMKKDPQKVQNIRDWRNRAGQTAITAPLLGKLLEIIIGFMGIGLAGCIDIVPFI